MNIWQWFHESEFRLNTTKLNCSCWIRFSLKVGKIPRIILVTCPDADGLFLKFIRVGKFEEFGLMNFKKNHLHQASNQDDSLGFCKLLMRNRIQQLQFNFSLNSDSWNHCHIHVLLCLSIFDNYFSQQHNKFR